MMMQRLFPFLLFLYLIGSSRAQQPNVLFIAVDDLRPELACYGANHMITPNIDQLASQGRLFRNHYVAVPTCGASRYALLTGLRPTASTDDNNAFNQMPTSMPTEPESWVDLLRRNGWKTGSIGKITHEPDGYIWSFPSNYDIGRSQASFPDMRFSWDEIIWDHNKWGAQRYPLFAYANGTGRVRNVSPGYEIGTDSSGNSLPDDAYPDGQMAQAAIEKLREYSDDDQRFCLAVGFHKPHLPFNAPKAYFDLYNPATLPPPSPLAKPTNSNNSTTGQSGEPSAYTAINDRAAMRHAYFACVSYMDAQVGKVLDELDALGLADNTIVVLWGDHGWCLDDYGLLGKHVVLEHGVESPLIIRAPQNANPDFFAGLQANAVVETIDIYPTIAELCGLTPPASAAGSSLVPILRNPFAPGKSHAYSRFGNVSSIRTPNWRLINAGGTNDLYDLSNFRYELENVATSNPNVIAELAPQLNLQASRSGTNYDAWAAADPSLVDPLADADHDGISNALEYVSGSNGLDPASTPQIEFRLDPLQGNVFRFTSAASNNDLTALPSTSSDLLHWSTENLEFLHADPQGNDRISLSFRLSTPPDQRQFFRISLFN